MKIAFVKQEVYQDLYVCPHTEKSAEAILLSSMLRVGPIGLMSDLGADFYIVKEEYAPETQMYRKVIPAIAPYLHLLKTDTLDKIPGQEFTQPGSPMPNGAYAVEAGQIDWSLYDVVISVNVSLPAELVVKYPQTLFAYMIGEANMATSKARFGYDVTLNQKARGIVASRLGEVDFPYTFVGADTLERIMRSALGRPSLGRGVFMEINSTVERPVTRVPAHFKPLQDIGQDVILHRQKIGENLAAIYDSKYFVKMGGRPIRGNSVAEAVSLGSLAIMNRDEVIHGELIIDECNVKSMDEVVALVTRLEHDDALYARLLERQRRVLQTLFFDRPLQSLEKCLEMKRCRTTPKTYTMLDRLSDRLYLSYCDLFNFLKRIEKLIKACLRVFVFYIIFFPSYF